MAQSVEIYSGKVVKADASAASVAFAEDTVTADGAATAVDDHMAQADEILGEVRKKADALYQARMAEIDRVFETRLAERLLSAEKQLKLSMDEISGDLLGILETALREIIGDPKDPKTLVATVERNVRRYQQEKGLRILVSPKDLEKIRPHWEDARSELKQVSLCSEDSLTPGRCLLAVGNRRFEIGLEAQIQAFRKEAGKTLVEAVQHEAVCA